MPTEPRRDKDTYKPFKPTIDEQLGVPNRKTATTTQNTHTQKRNSNPGTNEKPRREKDSNFYRISSQPESLQRESARTLPKEKYPDRSLSSGKTTPEG